MCDISQNLPWLPTIWKKGTLSIFYKKLNKLQIKLLWVFVNIDIVLGSIKDKMLLQLSDPLNIFINDDVTSGSLPDLDSVSVLPTVSCGNCLFHIIKYFTLLAINMM